MDQSSGRKGAGAPPLHWREWLTQVVDKLKRLPPDVQQQMLNEPVQVPLSQLMVLLDRAARFEHLVKYGYAVQNKLDALPANERNVERLWDALGNFIKAFGSTLQGADGQERVPAPAFLAAAQSEIANLQHGIPSKRFRLDGDTLGNNPHDIQSLVFKATAAVFLRLLMDRDKGCKQKDLAEIVAKAMNDGGFQGGHIGQVGAGRQREKIDRGITARTVIEWMRTAERGEAAFSDSYQKSLSSYRKRCKPEDIEHELAALTKTISEMNFLHRNRPDL